jgi:hypothetical protein
VWTKPGRTMLLSMDKSRLIAVCVEAKRCQDGILIPATAGSWAALMCGATGKSLGTGMV